MAKSTWQPKLRSLDPEEPKTLTDATLNRLRRDIVSGRLAAGKKLRTQELAANYEVGASPLREALFQLVSDRLVSSEGQRGFRVADLNNAELLDITEWRVHLETIALERSIERGDDIWEANAIAAFHRLKRLENSDLKESEAADTWEERHSEFHFALYSACGSLWLLRFCETLGEHAQRYRRAFVRYRSITPRILQEHQEILDLAIARDARGAVEILKAHIQHAAELAQTYLQHEDDQQGD